MAPSHSMALRPQPYPSQGRCIYCLKQVAKLTEEHIVPLALNGSWVIDGAACEPCRAHSNEAYENAALQCDLLRVPRQLLELRRRRANKKKPLTMPPVWPGNSAGMTSVEGLERLQLEPDQYPPVFMMVIFQPAGKLLGIDRNVVREGQIRVWFRNIAKSNQQPIGDVTVRQIFDHTSFAHMLAKIAYCYAVAERGLDGFNGEEIRQLLSGERDDIYNFVGGSERRTSHRPFPALSFIPTTRKLAYCYCSFVFIL
jgi:hypothetical protein